MIPQFRIHDSLLLVVDIQTKLIAKLPQAPELVRNAGFLMDAAALLGVPILATEQYPKGLGGTVPELAVRLKVSPIEKMAFSCCDAHGFLEHLDALARPNIVLVGMETHVCIGQTALDLRIAGYNVVLAVDAMGSRGDVDHSTALRRLEAANCIPMTVESVAFEWLRDAGHPQFKAVSKLVIERAAGRE